MTDSPEQQGPGRSGTPGRARDGAPEINWPFLRGRQLVIDRAQGVHLYTPDGRQILDAAGGAIVANIGWGNARVAERIAEITRNCTYVVPPWITPSRHDLVDALEANWLPPGLRRIHITSGGSDAVDSAMKLALQYHAARGEPGRRQIVTRNVSYHGTTVATTAASGHAARKRGLAHALNTHPAVATPYPLRCPLGRHHPDAAKFYLDDLRATIEAEGPATIAALLAEPISGSSGGAIVPPDAYWPGVRRICDEYGILLVLDEVMTGFGRTGKPFAFQHWDIAPDILVGGKGLAGGYAAIGGVFATETIGTTLAGAGINVMFHTFGAHPAACGAAAEVLTIMAEQNLVARSAAQGDKLQRALEAAFADHPHVAEVRGRGLLRAIEVVRDPATLEPFPESAQLTNRIVTAGLERGVFFYGGGTGEIRDIVCMGPAFTIGDADLERIASVLRESVDTAVARVPR
jgi:adenosylmethionine-8-amino-7-oxononanoate aminotransferase